MNQHRNSFPTVNDMTIFGEKSFFVHCEIMSRDYVTSQKNGLMKYLNLATMHTPPPCRVQKYKNPDDIHFFFL